MHHHLLYHVFILMSLQSAVHCVYNNASFSLTATPYEAYVETPGYPRDYLSNMSYTWLIESEDVNEIIYFLVEDCALEYVDAKKDVCQLDILSIYDGQFTNATTLYEGCCLPEESFSLKNSSGSFLLLKFETDSTLQERGFSIKYYNSGLKDQTTPEEKEEGGSFIVFVAAGAGAVIAIVATVIIIYCICKKKKGIPSTSKSSVVPVTAKAIKEGITDEDVGQIDLIELENQIRQGKISNNRLAPLTAGAQQNGAVPGKKKGKFEKGKQNAKIEKEEKAKTEKEEKAKVEKEKKAQKANGTISGNVGVGGWKEVGNRTLVIECDENDLEELILDGGSGYDIELIDQKLIDGDRLPSASLENRPAHHVANNNGDQLQPPDGKSTDPAKNSAPPRPTKFKDKDKKPDTKNKKKAFG